MSWKDTPCKEWTGNTAGNGYGVFKYIKGKTYYVHRITYSETHGPIPKGMCICHHCDNPPCYNIDHLFMGTQKDNIHDSISKGRFPYPPYKVGEDNGMSKLTWEDVQEIREVARQSVRPGFVRFKRGANISAKLARRFGVSEVMIRNVIRNDNWKGQ